MTGSVTHRLCRRMDTALPTARPGGEGPRGRLALRPQASAAHPAPLEAATVGVGGWAGSAFASAQKGALEQHLAWEVGAGVGLRALRNPRCLSRATLGLGPTESWPPPPAQPGSAGTELEVFWLSSSQKPCKIRGIAMLQERAQIRKVKWFIADRWQNQNLKPSFLGAFFFSHFGRLDWEGL